jgi:hypothetical protein
VAAPQPVLVLITEDPRRSHRANEALRIAVGLVGGEHEVAVVLAGPAVHLLDADTDDLVDGDDIAKFRGALRRMGVPLHVEAGAAPAGDDWNAEGHRVIPVSPGEIAALVAGATRSLVF